MRTAEAKGERGGRDPDNSIVGEFPPSMLATHYLSKLCLGIKQLPLPMTILFIQGKESGLKGLSLSPWQPSPLPFAILDEHRKYYHLIRQKKQ